jgi:hypothetical protein
MKTININGKDYNYICKPSKDKEWELTILHFNWNKVYGHSEEHCLENFKLQYETVTINNRVCLQKK